MPINFPNNPSNNDTTTLGGITYAYDSAATTWTANAPISTGLDSTGTISLIDSAYVQARQTSGGGVTWQSSIQTDSSLTAEVNKAYWVDTTSNSITATLPTSASVGDEIIFVDYARQWGTNNFLIDNGDSTTDLKYQGANDSDATFDTTGQALHIVYSGATQGWIPIHDDAVSVHATGASSNPEIEMLVVAGGGAGGTQVGGGGGAGGYRTSTQSAAVGTVLTVTVGSGGSGNVTWGQSGGDGSSSSVAGSGGSGIALITSAGGGGGGGHTSGYRDGRDGGSGGGQGSKYAGAGASSGNVPSVTPSQGNDGGLTNTSSTYNAGGGGGHGAVGNDGSSPSSGGEGGIGTANSITGSAIYYAGGGSGTIQSNRSGTGYNPAPQGGGGNGDAYQGTNGSAGTANTGGGGGGGRQANPGYNGGSGVVILKVLTADYSGTSSGSPTITTSGDYTILKFTGSGSYTL